MSHKDLVNLINRGPMLWCEHSKTYYHKDELTRDGRGGWINKKFDTRIHNESINQSQYKSGSGWVRGTK